MPWRSTQIYRTVLYVYVITPFCEKEVSCDNSVTDGFSSHETVACLPIRPTSVQAFVTS